MTKVYLKKKIGWRVENGHPWIFGNEIATVEGDTAGGSIVDVFTHEKKFLGRGYINLQSQIAVRLLTRDKTETIDEAFFTIGFRRPGTTGSVLAIRRIAGWSLAKPTIYPH